MTKFQLIVLVIFIVALIAGAASFALYKGNNNNYSLPTITIWGTFPANVFDQYVSHINNSLSNSLKINYVEQKPESFSQNFTNALALGNGPDAILVGADMLLPQMNKLILIPYSALSQQVYFESYADIARIYLKDEGVLALPFTVDPLVMYWNRDLFNSAGIATYPKTWDEFVGSSLKPGLVQKLTTKDQNGNIRKSAIAMGNFSNITNARELLGSLILQLGNPVTTVSRDDGILVSTLETYSGTNPASAFQFFSQFTDPSNSNYSWNRGLSNDKTTFISGALATYFGFASELNDIRNKNINLNFDVAPLPQLRSGGQKAVYAKMHGFSLVRASNKLDATYQVISILTSSQNLKFLSELMYAPSIRRDVIAQGSKDPYISSFNEQALIAKTWFDVDANVSKQILGNIIQSVVSGQKNIEQAIRDAKDQYDILLRQVQ